MSFKTFISDRIEYLQAEVERLNNYDARRVLKITMATLELNQRIYLNLFRSN